MNSISGEMDKTKLRTGYTTGACATATAIAAFSALLTGRWQDPVTIVLPKGETASFNLVDCELHNNYAIAGTIKDAGDDPDVTHGATIKTKVWFDHSIQGVSFKAGQGVGIVTKPGLPIGVGEPAINPVPRKMIMEGINHLARLNNVDPNVVVEISVPNGEQLTLQTWNPRLGIVGGISILGTTGIVRPYSCAAWIASIHMGIDVARANGASHVVGSTGSVSELTAQEYFQLPDWAMLDMGDFVGGMVKYLRKNPIPNLTVAGGFGKISKLANGATDLHSKRSQVDFDFLSRIVAKFDPAVSRQTLEAIRTANTANQILDIYGDKIAEPITLMAKKVLMDKLKSSNIEAEVMIVNRSGKIIATTHKSANGG